MQRADSIFLTHIGCLYFHFSFRYSAMFIKVFYVIGDKVYTRLAQYLSDCKIKSCLTTIFEMSFCQFFLCMYRISFKYIRA